MVSDHVDWPTLIEAVEACDPDTLWVTHGYSAVVARFFQERGRDALVIDSRQREESDEAAAAGDDSQRGDS